MTLGSHGELPSATICARFPSELTASVILLGSGILSA